MSQLAITWETVEEALNGAGQVTAGERTQIAWELHASAARHLSVVCVQRPTLMGCLWRVPPGPDALKQASLLVDLLIDGISTAPGATARTEI